MQTADTTTRALQVETKDGVVRLTLDRPDKRNALSRQLLSELREALEKISADTAMRVVVLAANGPAFCAGHDLGEMVGCSESEYHELFALCSHVMLQLRQLPQAAPQEPPQAEEDGATVRSWLRHGIVDHPQRHPHPVLDQLLHQRLLPEDPARFPHPGRTGRPVD